MNNTLTFEDIFRSRMFRIPDYQRGYDWSQKNREDLIEDLELLLPDHTHYTGTLVLRKNGYPKIRDEAGQSYDIFDVIDGQQRLTTIVLFMDTLHDEFTRLRKTTLAEGVRKVYLNVHDSKGQPITKLTLNRDCQEFFYNNVLGFNPTVEGPSIRSHFNLLEGHTTFEKFIKENQTIQGEAYENWLMDLYEKITRSLTVLLYEVESEMDAGVIFETMNDRGKPLTDIEKAKNHFLYIASKMDKEDAGALNEQINRTWNFVFEELMNSGLGDDKNENQLLRTHWLMTKNSIPYDWEGYKTIKEYYSLRKFHGRHDDLFREIVDYLNSLKNMASCFCDIHSPARSKAFADVLDAGLRSQIREASEKLGRLGTLANFIPLLAAVRIKAIDGGETYLAILKACEIFAFRVYIWQRIRTSTASSSFYSLANRYYKNPVKEQLTDYLTRKTQEYCTNARFAERFEQETQDWYHWNGLKYLLFEYELELARAAREELKVKWSDLWDVKRDSIEHILPQTPTEEWMAAFPDPARLDRWKHDIGNLTLTYDNSSLQNKSFQDKKGAPAEKCCYASSSFFVEREICQFNHWTEKEIIIRREKIKAWATERWKITEIPSERSNETNSPADRILVLAQEGGIEQEYQSVLDLAGRNTLYFHPYATCLSICPPRNHTITLFTIWPKEGYLDIGLWLYNFTNYLKIPKSTLQSVFQTDKEEIHEIVTRANAGDFMEKLKQVLSVGR